MKELDVKKIMGPTPKDVYEAVDLMIKAQNQVTEAIFIMRSIIEFPDCMDINEARMRKFMAQFEKDDAEPTPTES
jgi:hypothetical protein